MGGHTPSTAAQNDVRRPVLHPLDKIGQMEKDWDDKAAGLAAQHDNVLTNEMLDAIGISKDFRRTKVRRRVWQEPHEGVFLHGAAPPTWRQLARVAYYAAGIDSMISGVTLLALRGAAGVPDPPPVEITVPFDRELEIAGVTVVRSRRGLGPTRWLDGMRVSCVERALLDYAATAQPVALEDATESMLLKKATAELQLWRGLVEYGGRGVAGTKQFRRMLLRRPAGRPARSVLEILLGHELDKSGIGGIRNHPVTVDGKNYEIDRAFPDSMVALEADSKAWHGTRARTDKDKTRQAALERAGWYFVRTNWPEVVLRPHELIARLREALGRKAA